MSVSEKISALENPVVVGTEAHSGPADPPVLAVFDDLVDPDDFCRECRGTGGADEKTERGTTLFQDCFLCRGTGQRTIRVSSPRLPYNPIAAE